MLPVTLRAKQQLTKVTTRGCHYRGLFFLPVLLFLPATACLDIISQHIPADPSGICPDTLGSSAPKGRRKTALRAAVNRAGVGGWLPEPVTALPSPRANVRVGLEKHLLHQDTLSIPLWERKMGGKREKLFVPVSPEHRGVSLPSIACAVTARFH